MKQLFTVFCILIFTCAQSQSFSWNPQEQFTTENLKKIATTTDTLTIQSVIKVEGLVEVPESLTLRFSTAGKLYIANEKSSIEIKGQILARRQQIFDISANKVTSYRFESVSNITLHKNQYYFPEWWGVFPNVIPGKNGNTLPKASHHHFMKEMMLDIAKSGGGELIFDEGVYYIRDLIIDFDNIEVRGQGAEKTTLQFDSDNYGFSTRRGTIIMVQGPTLEKFYSKLVPEGIPIAGNYSFTERQQTIENVIIKDLTVAWNKEAASADPSMNGIAIMNARNVLVEGVHVNLYGANRAFFLGNAFEGDVTQNITIANSSCENSRTGVFILSGYAKDENPRKKMILDDINVINNHLSVVPMPEIDVKNEHLVLEYLDVYASGVFFIGNEYTTSFYQENGNYIERHTGSFLIQGNIIENADFGIRSWYGNKNPNKAYVHNVLVLNNVFRNFRLMGVMAPFTTSQINNNWFQVETLESIPTSVEYDRGEDYQASAIFVAKGPYRKYSSAFGPETVEIDNNIFQGCFTDTNPIVIRPKEEAIITITNNNMLYTNSFTTPNYDIVVTTDAFKYGTEKATVRLIENNRVSAIKPIEEASVEIDARRKKYISIITTQE